MAESTTVESPQNSLLMEKMGENMRREREKTGLTLRELAAALAEHGESVTYASLSKYERGEQTPRAVTVQLIALILGVSLGNIVPEGCRLRDEKAEPPIERVIPIPKTLEEAAVEVVSLRMEFEALRASLDEVRERIGLD
jgi:transcriptional regulator with XRE-family HTH domain